MKAITGWAAAISGAQIVGVRMSYYGVSKAVRRLEQEAIENRKVKQRVAQLRQEMSRVQT